MYIFGEVNSHFAGKKIETYKLAILEQHLSLHSYLFLFLSNVEQVANLISKSCVFCGDDIFSPT